MTTSAVPISAALLRQPIQPSDRPQEQAFRGLVRTLGLLERVMQPHFARFGISASQWGVLRSLHRAEAEGLQGLRITDLSERLLIRPPSVTGVLDRLERDGLVTRDAATDDLRAKCVRLTVRGHRLVQQVLRVHGEQIDRVLAGLKPHDCGELGRLTAQLCIHLEGLLQPSTLESAEPRKKTEE
ncbi:MAG TPA: MarR family transcriptional regulator [Tepidisphaeraceae bacterium]|nr:MarR family transcriptional regulator [Tepidisphaeraceae bacterium]